MVTVAQLTLIIDPRPLVEKAMKETLRDLQRTYLYEKQRLAGNLMLKRKRSGRILREIERNLHDLKAAIKIMQRMLAKFQQIPSRKYVTGSL